MIARAKNKGKQAAWQRKKLFLNGMDYESKSFVFNRRSCHLCGGGKLERESKHKRRGFIVGCSAGSTRSWVSDIHNT
jgi:hypothetical protein